MSAPDDAILQTSLVEARRQALTSLGRQTEAQQHLDMAEKVEPSPVEACFRRGVGLGRQGKPAEAAAEFQIVVDSMSRNFISSLRSIRSRSIAGTVMDSQ